MRKRCLIIFMCVVLFLSLSFLIKVNTTVYVVNYSNTRYSFDFELKINNKEVLKDSLLNGFPSQSNFRIQEKMKIGLHEIWIYSDKLNVIHKETVFILPNQYISIELFAADTLTLSHYNFPYSIITNGIQLTDSLIEKYKIPKELDCPIISENSQFVIQTGFNPFRY